MTDVSVVVPTRNRSELLAVTLRSVLWQRDVDLEVIVVDEASSDDTIDVVARADDRRISLIRHGSPRGLSAARNEGAERAAGEWLAFVDDDDVWAPDKLSRQLDAARAEDAGWAYAGVVNVGTDLAIVSGAPPPTPAQVVNALPAWNPIPGGGSNAIVARDAFRVLRGFDERLSACADWELWIRLAERSRPAAAVAPLVGYRLHGSGMSLDVATMRRETASIERIHHTSVDHVRLHRWYAETQLRLGRRGAALLELARAVARGGALDVADDVRAIARRRLDRRSGGRHGRGEEEWRGGARGWLQALADRSVHVTEDDPPDVPGTMRPAR